ncbi:PREDICTED: lethal(3)malignant brain tumor-like protein 3 isoform X1 [Dufourea novaeangliae]|uniref:lethal(3)malignant brain tumor-like protein 3 isoform X1 n=2 Tax=Dufourea novaeangliae TaxID=178035 RepID=UPI000767B49D|nr:PREDICTED: lethal(3)malignant brain tumor-like protein 3 isoform X1 [Dufourea novaeangliae]
MMATDNFKTMEEEIVVDDVDENSSTEIQQSDDPTAPVMPLLYIQQSKLRSAPPTTTNQTLVSSNATQLAAIINPVNNQIVSGQNKVFIQGPSQVATSQNKQHIVIHRPINTVSTTATSQGQKHILLRKSNVSTAQIVPLSSSQGNQNNAQTGKHTFAYLGTLIKPNKSRDSVVIPGALTTTQIAKQKLVIAPVLSQLAQTSTSTTTGSQSQTAKHMANLLLPVSIPQQSGPTKSSMFNLKINNGQLTTESKGTITVLRESKTTNSSTHPPPLHPIAKMSLLSANKGNSNSTDSIKITENPDSAVITPIPKKDDTGMPEKRKKTISNILRGSNEKRLKKQNLSKSSQDSIVDVTYTLSSPESEQDKDKKVQNDDDITLIKVVPSEDKSVKLNASMDDDIKIEIIKTRTSCVESVSDNKHDAKISNHDDLKDHSNTTHANDSNFDAAKVLDWKDGVGTLPGSTLKFCMNEFGIMEVVDEDENNKQGKDGIGDKENVCLTQNSSKSSPLTANSVNSEKKSDDRKSRTVSADTMYHCEGCGCYGLAAEFESPISCSPTCTEIIESKKQPSMRKDKDLKDLRAKRKRKRLLQEQQQSKEIEDKSDEKTQEKVSKSETDEDTKDTITGMDDESQGDSTESKYPWQTGKLGFSWAKYLEHCKAKAAPVKLFKDPFPYSKNHFKVGMKLEGIDPEHPSRYCVLTVVEVAGYRIRLHFDGYAENYDFWVNADSMDIFPVGWSEKNGHRLDPPKGYVASNFNWNAYLKICKATAAPKNIFSNKSSVFPTGFRVGMKLEAVDRKHSSLVCVASIAGLMDSRLLVHFDSWDEVYDYWADASSPYIHPVGWCHHNGHSLTPPNNYKDPKSFTWDAYLRETRSMVAPARAFKQRPPCGFKRGMKLEAVDKRVPQLIRVATVEDVKDHMLKIRFDGWPENHAYSVDDDSPDIHPMGWCLKTGHPLEPPLTPDNLNDRPECGTYGCRGIGHVKGPKFSTHNSASGCPYSPQNLHKVRQLSDRLNLKHETCDFDDDMVDKPKPEKTDKIKMERSEKPEKLLFTEERLLKTEKDIKQEDGEFSDKNDKSENSEKSSKSKHNHSDGQTDDDELLRKRKKRRQISEEPMYSLSNYSDSALTTVPYAANIPDKQLRMELYQSVYSPGYNPLPDAPHIWAKHSNALNRVVARQNTNPRRWSNEEVIKFIQSMPNCKEIGNIFRKHNIDGEAFLMLTQEDLVSLLGLRLGPAIKLYNSIVLLRRRAS